MAAARRERRRPARLPKGQRREPKKRILVLCEGKATEPEYLKGFERVHRSTIVEVEHAAERGVALTLVQAAAKRKKDAEREFKRLKDPNVRYDAVWCVFDNEHPNHAEACKAADVNGIELAISSPCIELWLLLHFREQPGMQDAKKLTHMLRTFVPGYDKHVDFQTYNDGYEAAVKRSKRLDDAARADSDPHRNPTTGVYRLTESIRNPTSTGTDDPCE